MYAAGPHVGRRAVHDLAATWSYHVDVVAVDLDAERTPADEFFLQVHLDIVDQPPISIDCIFTHYLMVNIKCRSL
jgi:hypothetical protein